MITKPILPPKSGYVEVLDEQGNHVYKPTAETLAAQAREAETKELLAVINALLGEDERKEGTAND